MESQQVTEEIRVLVIVPEPAQRRELSSQLAAFSDIVAVRQARDIGQVVQELERNPANAIVLDRAMFDARQLRAVLRVLTRASKSNALAARAGRRRRAPARFLRRIPIRTVDGFRILAVEHLISAVAHGETLHLTTSDGEHHTILYPLTELERKLDPEQFIRCSRSTIVNVAFVTRFTQVGNGMLTLTLSTGDEHAVSRLRGRALRDSLLKL